MHEHEEQPLQLLDVISVSTKKSGFKWTIPIIILLFMAAVFLFYRHNNEAITVKTDKKFDGASKPISVSVAKAKQRDMDVFQDALGTVTSRNSVIVKARIDGQLLNVYFREGQMVKAGELLALIDPRSYEVMLAQADALLIKDKALLQNAQIDSERYKTLLAQDSISKQQADTQESLVHQYRAALAVDQAQVDTAKLNLSYTRITAPISGRVGLRQVDAGNMIHSSDANGIVTITQLQPITVLFNIPEDNFPTVNQRMKADKILPILVFDRGQKLKLASGHLLTADNQIDASTGTIKLRAEFKNEDSLLYPNQFVNVKMLVDVQKDAIVIPVAGLQRGKNGDYVYILSGKNTVNLRPVTSGHADVDVVSIESGLKVGDEVVIDGADKLRDGAKVKLANAGDPASVNGDEVVTPHQSKHLDSAGISQKLGDAEGGAKTYNKEGMHHKRSVE